MALIEHFLSSQGIRYRVLAHTKPVFTCEEAALARNVPLGEMIKSILLVDKQKNYCLACLPADKPLDPQSVRAITGMQRTSFASKEEIRQVLGYEMGAVSPLMIAGKIPIVFDETIAQKQKVNISSGNPTAGIELSASDLIKLVKPAIHKITK